MAAFPQRPQRPIPATLQEKYFIEAVEMLWYVLEELKGIREELQLARESMTPIERANKKSASNR